MDTQQPKSNQKSDENLPSLEELRRELKYKNHIIKAFERQTLNLSSELNKFYGSYSYKIFYKLISNVFPPDSLRRKIAKFFYTKPKYVFNKIFTTCRDKNNESANLGNNQPYIKENTDLKFEPSKDDTTKNSHINKKTVLVIDRHVPIFDNDAGSRNIYLYIKLLLDMGFQVKFLGADFLPHEPYAKALQNCGVEVLYGEYYASHWREWFFENKDNIDFIFFHRPQVVEMFIDYIKPISKAKLIYHVADLHFLRLMREANVLKKKNIMRHSLEWERREISLMKKVDTVLTVSSDEKEIIDAKLGQDKAVHIPIFYYKKFNDYVFDDKKRDIMFVGGFAHNPNEDGAFWFVENVWRKLTKIIPDCRLFLIGSCVTDKINALSSPSIIVTGYVNDDELTDYYRYCKVAIIPIRYGAGVKGKTIEAMYNQIGVVATSTGLEGLENIEDYIKPSDTSDIFLNSILSLYTSEENLKKNIDNCNNYIKRYFSYDYAISITKEIFK